MGTGRHAEAMLRYFALVEKFPRDGVLYREMLAFWTIISAARTSEVLAEQLGVIATHTIGQTMIAGRQFYEALLADPRYDDPRRLERYGRKVYSQNDEDGIVAEIFRRIGTTNRTFLEFGVEGGLENNTLFLLQNDWRGLWIESDPAYCKTIADTFASQLKTFHLQVLNSFVTRENIDGIVQKAGLPKDLDLISIDIDFNDYYVWEALTAIQPRVVVIEYNGRFVPPLRRAVTYEADRSWDGSDYSGCSLQALSDLGERKGYRLVGCNMSGVNAFFVRADLCGSLFATPATADHLFQPVRTELFAAGTFRVGHRPGYGPWIDPAASSASPQDSSR